jgi:N-acetylneuraminate synthase
MIIDRSIKKYIIFEEEPIIRALEKISANSMRIIYVVSETGVLEGVLTDGDFRRWIVGQKEIDLHKPVAMIANSAFQFLDQDTPVEEIQTFFSQRIESIPLLDDRGRLVAVANKRDPIIVLGNREISKDAPAFIIAEIGNNHNGSIATAFKMVDKAVEAGADCIKFQMRNMAKLYRNNGNADDAREDLGSQYVLDLLSRFQLKNEELFEVFDYCRQLGVTPLCTPWDTQSVEILDQYGLEAFKIASADFTNFDLLENVLQKGKPIFCSTGMSTEKELRTGTAFLRKHGGQVILMHCNSTYPAPYKDINLNYLDRLQEFSDYPIGYSGHERGINIALAAAARGAKVIEKHFTLDRNMEGNDHKISLLPEEFREMVQGIRDIEQAMGTAGDRVLSQGELINRENLAKSLVINRDLRKGEIITSDMIEIRSPGKGLQPNKKKELVGRKTNRNLVKGDFFYPEDLGDEIVQPRRFNFSRPYGVPVRYHDVQKIAAACPMDILEIHLSYKDLNEDIHKYFPAALPHKLVVHSPELFSGDHILDLCARDAGYRNRSINELQRVVDITRNLKEYFPSTERPLIVVNAGGFSSDHFIDQEKRKAQYELVADSLRKIDQEGVELIPQTMPPYPWHFGGQRYHNLFVSPDEICGFCERYEYRVCLDTSHSKLACNYLRDSFLKFVERVAPYTAHLHIADARGVDGEGLQISEGEIDFKMMLEKLDKMIPTVSFIPEIWQGHKNNGQGFWIALDRLEKLRNN